MSRTGYKPDDLVAALEAATGVTWSAKRLDVYCELSPTIPVSPLEITRSDYASDLAAVLAWIELWNAYWIRVARMRYSDGDYLGSRMAGLMLESANLRDAVLKAGQAKAIKRP